MKNRFRHTCRALAAFALALGAAVTVAGAAGAQTIRSQEHAFTPVKIVEGLEHPWSLAFLPDGRILVTERPGRLRIIRDGRLDPQPVSGLPQIAAQGQGGMLDVVLHPALGLHRLRDALRHLPPAPCRLLSCRPLP